MKKGCLGRLLNRRNGWRVTLGGLRQKCAAPTLKSITKIKGHPLPQNSHHRAPGGGAHLAVGEDPEDVELSIWREPLALPHAGNHTRHESAMA